MTAYYNEIDPYAAEWLRNLIKLGYIADGVVDERDIRDVKPNDLGGFTQCHFFAGIGVWSHALRQSGWDDRCPVWTGSCPCQPFSAAGKGNGFDDERHFWPFWHHLIAECRPAIVFGEQVASKDGLAWFDLVSTDMEATGYAIGAADLCAASVGAPHIRQRLWLVSERLADSVRIGRATRRARDYSEHDRAKFVPADPNGDLANTNGQRCQRQKRVGQTKKTWASSRHASKCDRFGEMAHAKRQQCKPERPSTTNGYWANADWLFCRDGKWRAVEPGTFPLAHGATNRVGQLRAYGNAIVVETAQVFIEAYMEINRNFCCECFIAQNART